MTLVVNHVPARASTSRVRTFLAGAALLAGALPLAAQEKVDVATYDRIKVQAMDSSQVMDIMSWLTDVYGPRLSWSPNLHKAGDWAVSTMRTWGLTNVSKEPWVDGPAGMGWAVERFTIQSTAPNPFTIQAVPLAWSPGTNGKVTGQVMYLPAASLTSMDDLRKLSGKLRNVFIIQATPRNVNALFAPPGRRFTDEQLDGMGQIIAPTPGLTPQPAPGARGGRGGAADTGAAGRGGRGGAVAAGGTPPAAGAPAAAGRGGRGGAGGGAFSITSDSALRFLQAEGVAAILTQAGSGDGGTIFTASAARSDSQPKVARVTLGVESYGRIFRMVERKQPVTLELDLQVKFYPELKNGFNVVGEIAGTDPALKDQVVMIGGHFDSWHGGTGATDNAAGSATMMEAMRILKKLNLKPRRTIRIGLWTGEEQGIFGSANYVSNHFGTLAAPKPELAKFQAYFNVDNGTGKIRGIYTELIPEVNPIFAEWMKPFNTMGMKTVNPGTTGGTDHLSFLRVGIPGFQFVQDPIEYSSRTHHSNMDTYERIQAEDMKFNSMVLAAFAWQAAQRDGMLPRKVVTQGGGRGGRGGQ